jgi:hypothetical protein
MVTEVSGELAAYICYPENNTFLLPCKPLGLSIRGHCGQDITNTQPVMPTSWGEEAGTNYWGPVVRKGTKLCCISFVFLGITIICLLYT